MRRLGRYVAAVAVFAVFAAPVSVSAQTRVHRIGYIQTATPEEQVSLEKAFTDGLRELGYVEGRNVVIERRFAGGKQERLPELAADLVRLKVDVIVTGSNPVVAAVQKATTRIPIVMMTSRDPVGSGFVKSLSRPGGNITGISSDPTLELQSKRLELLKEAMPRLSRVAILWNPAPPGAENYFKVTLAAAEKLGLSTQSFRVRGRDEFNAAFAAISRERFEAVMVVADPIFFAARIQVARLTMQHRLPAVFSATEYVQAGGLLSYGSNLEDQFRRTAVIVDEILKGTKPADIPVEQATKFELAINLKAARALGVALPPSLRLQADHVVE